jgi:hypothetical protein
MTSKYALYTPVEIYELLPEIYRVKDAEHDGVLRELIEVMTEQASVVAESVEQLYDDLFIETSAPWVAPYIGDLIGYRTLHGVVPQVASPRAEVANTIGYRRRKGTASMLEQLARDVTGWPARAVEFFELLATTQYMNHVRPQASAMASLRRAEQLEIGGEFVRGAFDRLAHAAEMRNIPSRSGRYNIPNIGLFLWRIGADELIRSPLVPADGGGGRYRLDQLGTDRQLFARPRTEPEITHLAEPFDVPMPLTRRWLARRVGDYYGGDLSFSLESEGPGGIQKVPINSIRICDLSDDPANPGAWTHEPQAGDTHVALDPVLGRVAFADPPPMGETRLATFHHGLALRIGGGGYDRSAPVDDIGSVVSASNGQALGPLLGSVAAGGAVEIVDNHRYTAPATITVNLPPPGSGDQKTVLRSANRRRPLLSRADQVRLAMDPDTTMVLDGLILEGAPLVIEGSPDAGLRNLVLRHCTLVPGITRTPDGGPATLGRAGLIVLHPFASIELDHCILGPVVAVEDSKVTASDCVIDASANDEIAFCGRPEPAGGGPRVVSVAADRQTGDGLTPGGDLTLESCTVIGKVHATRLDISNSILLATTAGPGDPWAAPVWAERRQVGCVRFTFLPGNTRTPQQFHCVPRPGVDVASVPHHTSLRYGDAAYGQLRRSTDTVIRTGADDESEMGATHELYEPQRETNLRIRLDEYLRFGLEAGAFYAT